MRSCKFVYVYYNAKCSVVNQFPQTDSLALVTVIVDNSTDLECKSFNREYCSKLGYEYIDCNGNVGLSKAYNQVVSQLQNDDYVVLFDDDTIIPLSYFEEVIGSIKSFEADILLPIVKVGDIQLSPSSAKKFAIRAYDGTNPTAINSGMVVRGTVYNQIGLYNEAMFLDYIDHEFMRRVRQTNLVVKLMNATLIQDFSGFNFENIQTNAKRFSIFIRDLKVYCGNSFAGKLFYYFTVFKRALNLAVKHKSMKFFLVLLRGNV